jgi:hypothetical protein
MKAIPASEEAALQRGLLFLLYSTVDARPSKSARDAGGREQRLDKFWFKAASKPVRLARILSTSEPIVVRDAASILAIST